MSPLLLPPKKSSSGRRNQTIYFCRHAEATHNIKEREAIQAAIAQGIHDKNDQEKARRAVLNDITLMDAPLSQQGINESKLRSSSLKILNKIGTTKGYPTPTLVLVSPLRRALMTATELFYKQNPSNNNKDNSTGTPRFVAMEAIREKRTGFAADERSSVQDLEVMFPHVDFSDLKTPGRIEINKGEDNIAVRARAQDFIDHYLAHCDHHESIAIVTHKGWLRELRHALKSRVDTGDLHADFDLDSWHQTLYKNAEVRVAQFGWEQQDQQHNDDQDHDETTSSSNTRLVSIVSRSVENAMGSVIGDAVKHLIEKASQASAASSASMTYYTESITAKPTTRRERNTSESTLATECTMLSMSDNDEEINDASACLFSITRAYYE